MKEYKTLCKLGNQELDKEVNEHLQKGFRLYGAPYAVNSKDFGFLCQAMIKD